MMQKYDMTEDDFAKMNTDENQDEGAD